MFVYEFLKLNIDLCEVFPDSESSDYSQYKSFIEELYAPKFVVRHPLLISSLSLY